VKKDKIGIQNIINNTLPTLNICFFKLTLFFVNQAKIITQMGDTLAYVPIIPSTM